jgi:integrase
MLLHDPPTLRIKELPLKTKKVKLPSLAEFDKLRELVYSRGKNAGELFDFLALTGSRITASQHVSWGDVDWDRNVIMFERAKKRPYHMPLTKSLKAFLLKIKPNGCKDTERITKINSINRILGNCCKTLGIAHLSHHALRKWFVTKTIESNLVDIQTLSWWIGHHDGGVLLQKTYGQLRDEHSQSLAKLI